MKPPSVFADCIARTVDPAARRAAALARVRIVTRRPSRADLMAEAHRIAVAEGIPLPAALYQARQRAKGTR